jgi:8-oxo-dGTP pyrophosphatase MutT (NUDIX family)
MAARETPPGRQASGDTIDKVTSTALPPALESHTLLVAAVIVHDEAAGKVLLLQRGAGSKFAPLHWDLPSGKAGKGESVTAAAARELKEETGLTVDPASLRIAGIIHGAWGVEAPNGFLTVIFAARTWDGEPLNAEPRKHDQVVWFSTDEVPAELVPDRRDALLGYLRYPSDPVVSTDGF